LREVAVVTGVSFVARPGRDDEKTKSVTTMKTVTEKETGRGP
jgi:hypothetical protein